jgi:hypothetical protein
VRETLQLHIANCPKGSSKAAIADTVCNQGRRSVRNLERVSVCDHGAGCVIKRFHAWPVAALVGGCGRRRRSPLQPWGSGGVTPRKVVASQILVGEF